jgi:hypothetical protein
MSNFKISYLGIFLTKQKTVQELNHLHLKNKIQHLNLVYTEKYIS